MCVEHVCEYYGMAAVLLGREVGVALWGRELHAHGGEEGEEGADGRSMDIMESW